MQASDIGSLREFLRREYKSDSVQRDESHYRWLFDDNPDNDSVGPQYWIYEKDGAIQGQQAGIPFTLFVDGLAQRASWAIDLKVSYRYQMIGVGAVLNDAYINENDVTVTVNITDAAKSSFIRAGWEFLGSVPKYARPLSVAGIRAGLPGALGALAPVVYLPLMGLDVVWSIYRRILGFRLEPVAAFDQRMDELWKEIGTSYPIVAQRNYTRLRWRFDESPRAELYQRFYLYRRGLLKGYAVLRYGVRNGRRVAMVVDFLCYPRQVKVLLMLCAEQAKSAGMDDIQAVMCHCPDRAGSLLPAGFLLRDSTEHGFMVRTGSACERYSELLRRHDSWFVTMADCDIEWMILRD